MKNYFFSKVAIVTSKNSWFIPYAEQFVAKLKLGGADAALFHNYDEINNSPDVVFLLSCFSIVSAESLKKHKYNFVVHESALPQGKGWAPLFWQILEGKNIIPIVLFEATAQVDAGDIYLQDVIVLKGHELHDEIRAVQAEVTLFLCEKLLIEFPRIKPLKQIGEETFYPKRTPKDSELDSSKPLQDLFNQLRIASNEHYPAFFYHEGECYELLIRKKNASS